MKNTYYYLITLATVLSACSKNKEQINPVAVGQNTSTIPTATATAQKDTIIGWGDSLTAGYGSDGGTYLTFLTKITGVATINEGIPKQDSQEIMYRMVPKTNLHHYSTIIWAGRNNFKDSVRVKSDIAKMVECLNHKRYLVVGILNGDYTNEYKGTPNYDRITALNQQLAAIYGSHFIDIRPYIVSKYDPNNAADVKDYDHDVTPSSLRADSLHFVAHGYYFVAKKISQNMTVLLGH